MAIRIDKRYMLLPVSESARPKTLFLREGNTLLAELKLRLSDAPDFIICSASIAILIVVSSAFCNVP